MQAQTLKDALNAFDPRPLSGEKARLYYEPRANGIDQFMADVRDDASIRGIEMRLAGEVKIRRIELLPERPYLHELLDAATTNHRKGQP